MRCKSGRGSDNWGGCHCQGGRCPTTHSRRPSHGRRRTWPLSHEKVQGECARPEGDSIPPGRSGSQVSGSSTFGTLSLPARSKPLHHTFRLSRRTHGGACRGCTAAVFRPWTCPATHLALARPSDVASPSLRRAGGCSSLPGGPAPRGHSSLWQRSSRRPAGELTVCAQSPRGAGPGLGTPHAAQLRSVAPHTEAALTPRCL